jgi:hypothetical protein
MYQTDLVMPLDADLGIEYVVKAVFAANPAAITLCAPPQGAYLVTT